MDNISKHVVIVGAGFGGLQCAMALKNTHARVTLIDKNNHHLFQPLLYQVATAALSPADIAAPVRTIFRDALNIHIEMDEVSAIDLSAQTITRKIEGELSYDYLVLAPGTRHSYFGHDDWEVHAPGLKSLDDALELRSKILLSYEKSEHLIGAAEAAKFTTFVVVGGGPTGVELAGALAEIGRHTMLRDFPMINASDIKVILVEAGERILPAFPLFLSQKAELALEKLGVTVRTKSLVKEISADRVLINDEIIETANVIWAAGNSAPKLLQSLRSPLDTIGRVIVESDCSVPQHPNVFVIGDAAHFDDAKGKLLPGVAQPAMQQGRYVANIINANIARENRKPFTYFDKGNMATIGRAKAVAILFDTIQVWGFIAWVIWAVIHVVSLIKFRNRFSVMMEWLWYYVTYQPGARLIIERKQSQKTTE